MINRIISIGGFGLVILDVIVNPLVATRGRRNPWRATTLEWATSMPSPSNNIASIPEGQSLYSLRDDPDIAVSIAGARAISTDRSETGARR